MTSKAQKRLKRRNGYRVHAAADVSLPPNPWDEGPRPKFRELAAVIEERGDLDLKTGKIANPNGVRGLRYKDMLEIYHDSGWISPEGHDAGVKLRDAWLRTEQGQCAPWLRERVDSTPKPDAAIAIQIDRLSRLIRISAVVPDADRRVVECVAYHGTGIGSLPEYRGRKHQAGKQHLREAFDRLAAAVQRVA